MGIETGQVGTIGGEEGQMKVGDPTTLVLSRIFEAPAEKIWAAWTQPELLKQWYAPVDGWVVSRCEVDARIGGSYHFEFGPPDGEQIVEKATYLELDPPRKIVTKMDLLGRDTSEQTTTTIEFRDLGDKTEVVVTEIGYSSEEIKEMHGRGWTRMLDKLTSLAKT